MCDGTGKPEPPEISSTIESHAPLFPNRLLKAGLAHKILEKSDPSNSPIWSRITSVKDIKPQIESGLRTRVFVTQACQGRHRPGREERMAVRKMMSRYWSNSSIFAPDLVGAVIRQGSLIEKMHAIDWLHSPAVQSTMQNPLKSMIDTLRSCPTIQGKRPFQL